MELISSMSKPTIPNAAAVEVLVNTVSGSWTPRSSLAASANGFSFSKVDAAIMTGSNDVKAWAAKVMALSTSPTSKTPMVASVANRRLGVRLAHTVNRSRVSEYSFGGMEAVLLR